MNRSSTDVAVPSGPPRTSLSYWAIQAWAHSGVSGVYRRVDVTGRSRVPKDRPAILAANHSNALADVAIIVARMPRFPQFLAAASWWKWPPVRWLFRVGGVVPVHRSREGDTEQNASTFEACHAALAAGAHLAIFPEGEMNLEPALLPLKTGVARIALGAAAESGVSGIAIIPVGLVYDDRARFRSDLEIQFGEPIEVDEWVELYDSDPAQAVRVVTDLLADRLAAATVNHDSRDEAALINRAAALALADAPRGARRRSGYARRNALRRALAASDDRRSLALTVDAHAADLDAIGVTNANDFRPLAASSRLERVSVNAELGALAVPAALGVVANGPTAAVAAAARFCVRNEGWRATTIGVIGTFLSPMVWAGEYVALRRVLSRRPALAITAAGAAGGAATLAWWELWRRRRRITWRDAVGAERPEELVRAETSRAELREQVAAIVGPLVAIDAGLV
jgi:glycerol-3-phosphate O-acyltransferase / dihydroxyacetone phosphate acyltransferase